MAKMYLDYLAKKYPDIEWSGKTYEELMKDIIAYNAEKVSTKSLKLTQESFQNVLSKVKSEKRFILPNISEVLPKQSVFLRKGADRGKLLTDTLREKLTGELRAALNEYKATGKPSMVARRGKTAGRISPDLIDQFKQGAAKIFENYTKKDPKFGGVPTNIKTIAVTEMRSAINDIKHQYIKRMISNNPGYEVEKRWIHNNQLVRQARPGHIDVSNQAPIPADQFFKIPVYKRVKGRWVKTTKTLSAMHPHDPSLPPDAVIGCQCDSEYIIKEKKA
jgi:hypothetical protein